MAQLGEACTVNHAVSGSSPSCVKLTKSLQQAFNSKIAGSLGSRPKLDRPRVLQLYRGHCPSHIGEVLLLPVAVSLDMLHFASLRITLAVPEVVGTEKQSLLIGQSCSTQAASLRCSLGY